MALNLQLLSQDDFPAAYELMEKAFPPAELRSYQNHCQILDHPNYRLLGLKDHDSVTAILGVWEFESFRFVEHFAVSEALRGQGIGNKLLKAYIHQSALPVVLEVEPPANETARRRIHFYLRLGCHLNDNYPYVQPPLQNGQASIPLILMSTPIPLSLQEFSTVKRTLYRIIYKVPEDWSGR